MLRTLIQNELRLLLRQRLLQIAALSLLLLTGLSLALSFAYHRTVSAQIEAANAVSREHWEAQGDKNQHSAAHYGVYLFKPKLALAFWDHGIDKYVGSTLYTEAHKRNRPQYKPIEDSPMLAKWGELSPAFLLLVLLPLILIWLSTTAISGERERGTLAFLVSQGVPWRTLLLGKTLARWLVGLALCLPAFIGMAVLLSQLENSATVGLGHWALLLSVYLLYLGVFIHLGIAASARFQSSTGAMLFMLGFWLVSIWGLPRLGGMASEQLYPLPSEVAFDHGIHDELDSKGIRRHDASNPQTVAFTQKTLAEYGVDRVEDLPVNFNGLILQAAEETNDQIFDEHYEALFESYRQQSRALAIGGLFSPFLAVKQLSMGLCQTDVWTDIAYQEAADRYRKAFIKALNQDLIESGPVQSQRFVRSRDFWREAPRFEYALPGLGASIRHHGLSLGLLALWFGLSALFLFASPQKL